MAIQTIDQLRPRVEALGFKLLAGAYSSRDFFIARGDRLQTDGLTVDGLESWLADHERMTSTPAQTAARPSDDAALEIGAICDALIELCDLAGEAAQDSTPRYKLAALLGSIRRDVQRIDALTDGGAA